MILYSSTLAFALSATVSWASQVCSPEHCLDGISSSQILAYDSSSSKYLTPGTYSDSSLSPSSSSLNITRSSDTLTVSIPSTSLGFSKTIYRGSEDVWDNGDWSLDDWKSIYLPSDWYAILEGGKVVWGAIPDKGQLPIDVTRLKLVKAASSVCDPPCSSHGVCKPSNTSSTGTCQCAAGWAGSSCDQCATGFWGPSCSPGPSNCTIWDDGLSGTGKCLGTASLLPISACNCDHGTCTSSNQCICSAGWQTNSTVSLALCNTCAEGFFRDSEGNCLACPLGCDTCTLQQGANSTATCTSCSYSLSLTTANPATCASTIGSCADGTYYDASSASCKSCSPACSTCTGPSTSDCLSCASPRMNLQGSCVYYDASTGICDSALSTLQGVYVVNLDKSECDACPSGCLECHIPSFSNIKGYDTLQCSSCQEGYLLEDGKCVRKCNDGWFLPEGSAAKNGTCQKCDSTCSTCVSRSTTCTSCPSPLYASGGTCLSTCPSSTTPLNGTCVPCPVDCTTCSTSTECSTCPSDRPVTRNGRCVDHCSKDEYHDSSRGCQACDWRCSSCSAGDSNSCTSCADGYILKKGECVAAGCNEGAFASGLGVCLSELVDKSSKSRLFWLFFLIILLLGGGIGGFWWYVRRKRQKTRKATKEFGDKLDERTVQDNLRVLRLERVLGLQRILTSDEPRQQAKGYEEKKNKRFRELLLPSKRRRTDVEKDIELKSANFASDRMTYGYGVPPPPYVPSKSSSPAATITKGCTKRDLLDSIPTSILPSFVSPTKPTFDSSSSSSLGVRPKIERKESNGNTTIHSMSSPISPDYQTSLMPPPRPGMIRINTQEREREVNRSRRGDMQILHGEEDDDVEFERRLRDLWSNLKTREQEGWI
nr:uncharacterized protein I203_04127 [Kwoniella mangroviensis CBS 8507]OCF66551.1 hypothetical protein I203_04127 [Kwoniella mangroviensis CBS 8507]